MTGIDILLASYNGEGFIRELLDSVLGQSYSDFSLIIRDDGSKDKTPEIIREYAEKDGRIKIIEDGFGNLGFVKNFEVLLERSEADLVMLCDQDDVWFSDKVEKYVKTFEMTDFTGPLLIHSDSVVCDERMRVIKKRYLHGLAKDMSFSNMFFHFTVQGAGIMINRDLLSITVPFIKGAYLHDRYIHVMAELFGKRVFIPYPTMYYRQHTKNQIGSNIGIIEKILKRRYFDCRDRVFLHEIYELYKDKMDDDRKGLFEAYFKITFDGINRIKRLRTLKKNNIRMHISKKIFLLIKG